MNDTEEQKQTGEAQTKFEEGLKAYFPDIYELHMLGKSEANIWELVKVVLSMRASDETGMVRIYYSKGHIDAIRKETDVLAYKQTK